MPFNEHFANTFPNDSCPDLIRPRHISHALWLEVIIFLVLLVSWLPDKEAATDIQVVEYFSGVGRIAAVSDYVGYKSMKFDLNEGASTARKSGRRNPCDLNSNAGFILAIKLVLRGKFNELVATFGICCSSFVPVNRGTGCRDLLVPEGDEAIVSVRKANKLLSRNLVWLQWQPVCWNMLTPKKALYNII